MEGMLRPLIGVGVFAPIIRWWRSAYHRLIALIASRSSAAPHVASLVCHPPPPFPSPGVHFDRLAYIYGVV
jgi:hypothetical protein